MGSDAVRLGFRVAGPADVDRVVELVQSAYRGETSRAGWTTEADLLDGVRTDAPSVAAIIADPRSTLLLAVRPPATGEEHDPDTIVACCHLRDDGDRAYFGMFAVAPGVQGGGIGRAVVVEAQRRAVEDWHAGEMWMTVIRQRHDLIAWYERLGFRLTGETQPFPYGNDRFGLPKRPDLEFAVLSRPLART